MLVVLRLQTLQLHGARRLVDGGRLRVRIEVRDERIRCLDHTEQAGGIEVAVQRQRFQLVRERDITLIPGIQMCVSFI